MSQCLGVRGFSPLATHCSQRWKQPRLQQKPSHRSTSFLRNQPQKVSSLSFRVAKQSRVCDVRSEAGDESRTDSKDTLNNLDSLLGIEEEPEIVSVPVAPPPRPAEPLASTDRKIPEKRKEPEEEINFAERSIASMVYILPLIDGLKYSQFLLMQFPVFGLALLPLMPIYDFYRGLGFLGFLVFFGIYFGVGQNKSLKPYVRFSGMQAVVLDILLILPDVLFNLFSGIDGKAPTSGPLFELQVVCYNTVFLFVYSCAVYGAVQCWRGKDPTLPLVGGAADQQSGR